MNRLYEVVLWGGLAVLLGWGLSVALACVLAFRQDLLEGSSALGDRG